MKKKFSIEQYKMFTALTFLDKRTLLSEIVLHEREE
jgi:hypothetical protein